VSTAHWHRRDTFYFSLIGVAELLTFFGNPGHFFMGDTLLWMGFRYRSMTEFFRGFVTLDPAFWYRPLAQRTVESALYPIAGLHPMPYRIVSFILFFACTIAVFIVAERITHSRRTAWLATLFFAPHVTHAFTTYDTAFVPEMVFTLFYIWSVVSWISWVQTRKRASLVASALLFVGSLISKETAVTVPFTLLVVWLFLPRASRPRLRSLMPHFVILGCYLIFAIGYLHIREINVRQLIERPGTAGQPGYQLVIGKNVQDSTSMAFSWAFSIPRGTYGQWPPAATWMITVLKTIRILICTAALFALFTPHRKFLLIGIAWFLIAAAPTLPLLDHFLPYYLFAPMVGFSIAIGAVLDWVYGKCARFEPRLGFALCSALIAIVWSINASAAWRVQANHFLLGGSADAARDGMKDMRSLHPHIPNGTTMVIFNEERPSLFWDQGKGMLYQMAYNDESIRTEYSSQEISISGNEFSSGKDLAFKLAGARLVDVTSFVKQRPDLLLPHAPNALYHLELSKQDVAATGDTYVLGITELEKSNDVTMNVLRAYNGVVEDPFQVKLDRHGRVEFKVGGETKPGTYSFVALQRVGEPNWVTVNGSIRVH
jgi:hypothetical protein